MTPGHATPTPGLVVPGTVEMGVDTAVVPPASLPLPGTPALCVSVSGGKGEAVVVAEAVSGVTCVARDVKTEVVHRSRDEEVVILGVSTFISVGDVYTELTARRL